MSEREVLEARKARRERIAAARATEAPFGPEVDGSLADLRPGDYVVRLGDGHFYRRYRVEAAAESVEPVSRYSYLDGTLAFSGFSLKCFGHDAVVGLGSYPVRYRRRAN